MKRTGKETTEPIPGIEVLHELLRSGTSDRTDLIALWKAGDWLDRFFGGRTAGRKEMGNMANALKRLGGVAASVETLHKCRKLAREWELQEVEFAQENKLSWNRMVQ